MEAQFKIKSNWNETKAILKKNYSKLKDEDLTFTVGKEEELLARIAKRIGKTEQEVIAIILDLQSAREHSEIDETSSKRH